MSKIIVKRHFAVWLEDAFEVEAPTEAELAEHEGDLDAWAHAQINAYEAPGLYERALDENDDSVRLMWEDEHKSECYGHDDVIFVDTDYEMPDGLKRALAR